MWHIQGPLEMVGGEGGGGGGSNGSGLQVRKPTWMYSAYSGLMHSAMTDCDTNIL